MIVVFGSINVDLVVPVKELPRPGETVLGPGYRVVPGGKGANQALAARRAGAEVHMAGAVGGDGFAEVALASLREAAVDLKQLRKSQAPTGAAFIAVDGKGANLIIVASGANQDARQSDVADSWLGPGTMIVLQMEVPFAENWKLVKRARQSGARTLLNCAPAAPVPADVLAELDWLVVNETEAIHVARAQGHAAVDAASAAQAIARSGNATVIVTLGDQGARAFPPGGPGWAIGTLPVNPIDTTGAGDAFVGAFAAAVDRGQDMAAALRYGSVAGALACEVAGAQPSLPPQVTIERRLQDLPAAVRL
ncbi:MAG: ribokinase [Dongiaceae bacterium]